MRHELSASLKQIVGNSGFGERAVKTFNTAFCNVNFY